MTLGAVLDALNLDLPVASENRLLKGDGQAIANVGALLRAAPGCRGGATEEGIENIAKSAEDVVEAPEAAEPLIKALAKARPGMPEAVIGGPLVGVAKDLEGFIDLLELLLGAILRVAVRMVLEGELPEGPLLFPLRRQTCPPPEPHSNRALQP